MAALKDNLKKFYAFLRKDSWLSLIVLFVIAFVVIKFIFFPLLSFATRSPLPLVVVESCSMNHPGLFGSDFDLWWQQNGAWYIERNITKEQMLSVPFNNGLKMGDIILLSNRGNINFGNIIVFSPNSGSLSPNPIIHRVVSLSPLETKGDFNSAQLTQYNNVYRTDETSIQKEQVIGHAIFKIPRLGWAKLIFVKLYEHIRGIAQQNWC